jgi:hypothetical protein
MTRNEWIARRSEKYYDAPSKDGSGYDWNPCINVAKADADALEAANVAPWTTEAEAPASDEIINLREEVAHWRVKAEAYGGMVHGCSPVFERIGFPIESHKPDGRVGGIARAAEAIGVEMARLRAAPALTDTAAKVVEAAVLWLTAPSVKHTNALEDAINAHLAAKQGGAS